MYTLCMHMCTICACMCMLHTRQVHHRTIYICCNHTRTAPVCLKNMLPHNALDRPQHELCKYMAKREHPSSIPSSETHPQTHRSPYRNWSRSCSPLVCFMYVCMHACMHVCMYVCMHACMYDGWPSQEHQPLHDLARMVDTYIISTYIYVYMYIYIYMYVYTYMYIHVYVYTYMYIHLYVYNTCIYVHVHINIYIYIYYVCVCHVGLLDGWCFFVPRCSKQVSSLSTSCSPWGPSEWLVGW